MDVEGDEPFAMVTQQGLLSPPRILQDLVRVISKVWVNDIVVKGVRPKNRSIIL